jgi:hypothetical protein
MDAQEFFHEILTIIFNQIMPSNAKQQLQK